MKRFLLTSVAAAALLFAAAPAHASLTTFLCTTTTGPCASAVTQATQLADQLKQLAQEVQTAESDLQTATNTLNTLEYAIRNTESLPANVYSDITGQISQFASLINQANMTVGQAGGMLHNLGNTGGYPGVGNLAALETQLNNENNAVANAVNQAAQVINLLTGQAQTNSSQLASLEVQGTTTTGQQQTLQAVAALLATNGQMQVHSTTATAATMQALLTAQTAVIDRQAASDALNRTQLQTELASICAGLSANGGGTPWWCAAGAQTSPGAAGVGAGGGVTMTAYSGAAGTPIAATLTADEDQDFSAGTTGADTAGSDQDFSGGVTAATGNQNFSGGETGQDFSGGQTGQDFSGGTDNSSNQDFSAGDQGGSASIPAPAPDISFTMDTSGF